MTVGKVRRTIRFFAWESLLDPSDFDLLRAIHGVSALDDEDWKYEALDMTTAALVDKPVQGNTPAYLRFFRLREGDDLPHKMDLARTTTPVEVLAGESITDWTHVAIWPDGYAAHDPHRDAPTLNRLAAYVRDKTNERVRFVSLYDRNLIDQLRELEDLRAVELRIAKPDAVQDAEDRDLGMFEGILNMARQAETATLATTLSVGRSRKRHLNPEIKDDVVALAEAAGEFLDHLVVRGVRNGRTVSIDLIHQRIESKRSIQRAAANVRQPSAEAMYETIISLRRELDEDGALMDRFCSSG